MYHEHTEAEIKNTKMDSLPAAVGGRLEGKPLPESPSVASSPSPTPPHQSPWWEGSSPPPGPWVCGGNLIQSLYVWSLLKSMWCALHVYGSIYAIPIVDIMVYDDTCYASKVVLEFLWFVILRRCFMIHVMISILNALFISSWGAWQPPSRGRWERFDLFHTTYKSLPPCLRVFTIEVVWCM